MNEKTPIKNIECVCKKKNFSSQNISYHLWQKCHNLSTSQYFLMSFATFCLKDRKLKSENFKLFAWVKKKLLKKFRQGKGVNSPPPRPMHNRVNEISPILFLFNLFAVHPYKIISIKSVFFYYNYHHRY